VSNGSRPPVGPTPTLLSIFRDLARPTPRIENLGVGSHTKDFGVGFQTRIYSRLELLSSASMLFHGGHRACGRGARTHHVALAIVFYALTSPSSAFVSTSVIKQALCNKWRCMPVMSASEEAETPRAGHPSMGLARRSMLSSAAAVSVGAIVGGAAPKTAAAITSDAEWPLWLALPVRGRATPEQRAVCLYIYMCIYVYIYIYVYVLVYIY